MKAKLLLTILVGIVYAFGHFAYADEATSAESSNESESSAVNQSEGGEYDFIIPPISEEPIVVDEIDEEEEVVNDEVPPSTQDETPPANVDNESSQNQTEDNEDAPSDDVTPPNEPSDVVPDVPQNNNDNDIKTNIDDAIDIDANSSTTVAAGGHSSHLVTTVDYADHWAETGIGKSVVIDLKTEEDTQIYLDQPLNGDVENNKNGIVTYTPNEEFHGIDTFRYNTDEEKYKSIVKVIVSEDVEGEVIPEPAECKIYGVHDGSKGNTQLMTIDPNSIDSDQPTLLGPVYEQFDVEGAAINPVDNMVYLVSGDSSPSARDGFLYLVDAVTGEIVLVGKTGLSELTALAFHPDGSLWGWSAERSGKRAGIVNINVESAKGQLVLNSTYDVEGLAWSTNGRTLYAVGQIDNKVKGGVTLWAWHYDGKTFSRLSEEDDRYLTVESSNYAYTGLTAVRDGVGVSEKGPTVVCDNILKDISGFHVGEVESLDTLAGGMLMFALEGNANSTIYVYDPYRCEIVPDTETQRLGHTIFTTNNDLEAIAWPLDCQPQSTPMRWQVKLRGNKVGTVCLEQPRWLNISGEISLQPSQSAAYLEASWQVLGPENAVCPPVAENSDELINCTQKQYSKRIIYGDTKFKVTGWWAGASAETAKRTKTLFSMQLFDLQGNALTEPVNKILTSVGQCFPPDEPLTAQQYLELYFQENYGAEDIVISDNHLSVVIDGVGYHADLTEPLPEEPFTDEGELELLAVEDQNGDGMPDFQVIYPDGTTQMLLYDGATEVEPSLDDWGLRDYFHRLGFDNIQIDGSGILSVEFEGNTYNGALSHLLDYDPAAKTGKLTVIPTNDLNNDGYEDLIVTYINGQEQVLYYLGGDEEIVEVEEEASDIEPAFDTIALTNFLSSLEGVESVELNDDGTLSVVINGVTYRGALASALDNVETTEGMTLTTISDANQDGYDDFVVTYPDGQQQLLYYFGNNAEEVVAEEVIEDDADLVEEDNVTEEELVEDDAETTEDDTVVEENTDEESTETTEEMPVEESDEVTENVENIEEVMTPEEGTENEQVTESIEEEVTEETGNNDTITESTESDTMSNETEEAVTIPVETEENSDTENVEVMPEPVENTVVEENVETVTEPVVIPEVEPTPIPKPVVVEPPLTPAPVVESLPVPVVEPVVVPEPTPVEIAPEPVAPPPPVVESVAEPAPVAENVD